MKFFGWYSVTLVSTIALQTQVPGFESWPGQGLSVCLQHALRWNNSVNDDVQDKSISSIVVCWISNVLDLGYAKIHLQTKWALWICFRRQVSIPPHVQIRDKSVRLLQDLDFCIIFNMFQYFKLVFQFLHWAFSPRCLNVDWTKVTRCDRSHRLSPLQLYFYCCVNILMQCFPLCLFRWECDSLSTPSHTPASQRQNKKICKSIGTSCSSSKTF